MFSLTELTFTVILVLSSKMFVQRSESHRCHQMWGFVVRECTLRYNREEMITDFSQFEDKY